MKYSISYLGSVLYVCILDKKIILQSNIQYTDCYEKNEGNNKKQIQAN